LAFRSLGSVAAESPLNCPKRLFAQKRFSQKSPKTLIAVSYKKAQPSRSERDGCVNYLIADQILMVISVSACEPSSACGWHTLFILSALLRGFCIPQT
jgi:hypothetical protein